MNTRLGGRSTRARSVRLIGALALGAAALALAAPANTAGAVTLQTVVFANIGDVPYTSAQTPLLSALTAHVNADPDVEFVAHTGDFKGGSDSCSDTAFQNTFNGFQRVVIDHGDQHNNRYDPVYDVAHPNISRLENWGSNTGGILSVQRWQKVTVTCGTPGMAATVSVADQTVTAVPTTAVPEGPLAYGIIGVGVLGVAGMLLARPRRRGAPRLWRNAPPLVTSRVRGALARMQLRRRRSWRSCSRPTNRRRPPARHRPPMRRGRGAVRSHHRGTRRASCRRP